ncbi:thiamine pyrophosphate-binding protein [Solirubrobacter sp. CPCC 204708]|uniref:Thiamine pyrophosphate-binding protein n=1 Tax=Solirubrobacter deserti TaxID=2282478 RepID=A0ABT4RH96_9ACTN|nr:thiamine pyrophosphate-binding protein [Solirubrobacter deserti]MBE2315462.1 thiamine pyrophosphate-binding protein [Solirubrobacter deserti]MDA0137695.1 thiamine pyrophosphate-binding protein [Solirubrobacter deserti]
MPTVRDTTFDVLRRLELTTIFSNPGSTEVPLLAGLPEDLRFVLALHEGSVVSLACGFALGTGRPALALLHSTPGLGNAVAAIATSRLNRAPVVVLVGQQDRRHLAQEPFLAGRLRGLAGEYPVFEELPVRPQDVPGTIVRAFHAAETARGPALVIVPMDDWLAPAPEPHEILGPQRLVRSAAAAPDAVRELAAFLGERPAIIAGAGADWGSLVALAERLGTPVFQEPFGGAAGFPQDHPQFAGIAPARRERLRAALDPFDTVLVVGTGALRQYPYDAGPLTHARLAVITADPDEAHRSPAELAVLGDPAAICSALAAVVEPRRSAVAFERPAPPEPGEPLYPGHALAALAERLPRDAIVVEESPSSRPELHARLPATAPGAFVSAMGMLGFALPAATGLRMAGDRPVVAVVGDGSSLYQIQALWTAAQYGVGVLFVVLRNGGYAIMDRLAEHAGAHGPWPKFDIDIAAMATAQGCQARRITTHAELLSVLDESPWDRSTPLLLDVAVAQDETFDP